MDTKNFGTAATEPRDYATEAQELVGVQFPIETTVDQQGNLVGVSYNSTWREGSTTPKEVTDKNGKASIEYEENYTDKKLTNAQIKKIDQYIQENIVG